MRHLIVATLMLFAASAAALAQGLPANPQPTHANIAYAPAEPVGSRGHLLDLYLPAGAHAPLPLVIWTGGSAWFGDNGKDSAGWIVPALNQAGYAVAGVSVRSSAQVKFPGQLYDIKAAIRFLRANAKHYGIDGRRIAIIGDSSGGWTSAITAVTGDVPALEGTIGTTGVSSAVQAAIAFYPPSKFTDMDRWAAKPCQTIGTGNSRDCHDDASSPESQLIGCAIQQCPDKTILADPSRYISANDPPIMILHGQSDLDVPHEQGEWLYQNLNKACHDAIFISLPRAIHGPAKAFLSDSHVTEGATIRSTTAAGCMVKTPAPYRPSMATVIDFLDAHLQAKTAKP